MTEMILGRVIEYLPITIALTVLTIVVTYIIQRKLRGTSWERFSYFTHYSFCLAVGWILILASARFNYIYTLAFIGTEFLAYCAVGVNIAGGIALHSSASAFVRGNKKRSILFAILYIPILFYSLLAANSTLLTGDATTRQKASASVSQQEAFKARIEEKKLKAKELINNAPTKVEGIPSVVRNSNGVSVSMASHCRPGNWYARNRSTCRDYLAAISASSVASSLTTNKAEQADLLQAIADSERDAPVPQQSAFFGFDVPPRYATLALALVMELAAITVLLHVALELSTHPPQNKNQKTVEPVRSDRVVPVRSGDEKIRSAQTASSSAGGEGVKDSPEKKQKSTVETYYEGGSVAAYEIFRGTKPSEITDDQILGYLYQLAKYNGHKKAIADRINDALRYEIGIGIGKTRLLKFMNQAVDTILVTDHGGSKSYTFRRLDDDQETIRDIAGGIAGRK